MSERHSKPHNRNVPKCPEMSTTDVRSNPFKDLKISSWDPLKNVSRSPCPVCRKSRKFYCYDCYVLVGVPRSLTPSVTLPVKIDIDGVIDDAAQLELCSSNGSEWWIGGAEEFNDCVKHVSEVAGKSTATHAKILSPDWVNIYQFPDMPKYDKETTVLVYPKEGSMTIEKLASLLKKSRDNQLEKAAPLKMLEKVVFIDSTWPQSYGIRTHSNLCDLMCVQLKDAVTFFWRTQNKSPNYLSTIEAIYYFVREYHNHTFTDSYNGQYDDLLYYFAYQYNIVQHAMTERAALKRSAEDDKADPDISQQKRKRLKIK